MSLNRPCPARAMMMPTSEQMLPIIVGLIALCLLLVALRLAYLLGLRTTQRIRGSRFDRIPARIQLDETEWMVEFIDIDIDGNSRNMKGWIRFQQIGPRVLGSGEDETGRVWSAEGITFGNKLAYLYSDRNDQGHTIGSVQVELSADLSELHGLRSIWGHQNSLMMQPIKLIHVDPGTTFDDNAEATSPFQKTFPKDNVRVENASIHDAVVNG